MMSALDEDLGIAVVDDDPVFRELTCAMLSSRPGFIPVPAASDEDLFAVLAANRIDCIVLDYDLGGYNGLSIKTQIDKLYIDPPPIVMLTGDGRESTAIKAFRMGVNDYLPKHNLQPKSLVSTIARVVATERERLLKVADYKRLTEAASIDLVSGLLGRAHLDDRLQQLCAMPLATRRSYAVIIIEMLDYKSIVQDLGIKGGDAAIREFAKRLKAGTRSEDISGRYEGGMFLVIADVKADSGLLRTICDRFAAHQSIAIELSAAKLVLGATVAGMLCDVDDAPSDLTPARLLEPVLKDLARSKEQGIASYVSRSDGATDASLTSHSADRPLVLPAAEQLRTGDRRNEPRHRVFKRGVVHLIGSQSTFNCTVRNMSENGAGLRLDTPFAVPAQFDLEIIGASGRRRAVLRWQTGIDFGVSFRPS